MEGFILSICRKGRCCIYRILLASGFPLDATRTRIGDPPNGIHILYHNLIDPSILKGPNLTDCSGEYLIDLLTTFKDPYTTCAMCIINHAMKNSMSRCKFLLNIVKKIRQKILTFSLTIDITINYLIFKKSISIPLCC